MPSHVPTRSRHAATAEALREEIHSGALTPGPPLPPMGVTAATIAAPAARLRGLTKAGLAAGGGSVESAAGAAVRQASQAAAQILGQKRLPRG